ncbi:ribosome biogenesis GTPase Der [Rubrobacter marinus]|uniref:hypothetical protein n=1 Tax=Rubrobacter marinus TaxID=2653852 RepID=UPI001D18CEEA|nr:hypothetical protein [Rubrobacter marinus]
MLVNKSDLVDEYRLREIEADVVYRMTDLKPPLLAISALSGAGVSGVVPLAARLHSSYNTRVPTHEVAEFVNELTARTPPPGNVKIRFATQTGTAPPRFSVFATRPNDVPDGYLRFLENSFRERYGLRGVSVKLRLKSSR